MKLKRSTGMILLLIVLVVFAAVGSVMNKKFLEGMDNHQEPTCNGNNHHNPNGPPPPEPACNGNNHHNPNGPPPPVPAQNPAYPDQPVPLNPPPVPGPPPPIEQNPKSKVPPPPILTVNGLPPAPPGDEYILKSQIVPPVCPACPSCPPVKVCPKTGAMDTDNCPPCPACSRCPEPAFECKKVPNYNSKNVDNILPESLDGGGGIDGYMPKPILNDFSEF
tara:strand:- start:4526 stop:5185 length:660 start_codon:yes stop_codon:yes gene_type:complete